MRILLTFVLILACVGSAAAANLGNSSSVVKDNSHVLMNWAQDNVRDGGEDIASAIIFTAIPFSDTGATCDNVDDYDVACPYSDSTSPDVAYAYTSPLDAFISIDLLGSTYDTKVYVYDADMNLVACNDDFHPGYVSFIEEVSLNAGMTYYIVIDGYGGDCGEFVLNVIEFIPQPPCFIECCGLEEDEPTMVDGYVDQTNGGCNGDGEFSTLGAGTLADVFCGVAGWYIAPGGSEYRDTDWIRIMHGETGIIEWTVTAEAETFCYLLQIGDCQNVTVTQSMTVTPCQPETMIIENNPYSIEYIFVASTSFSQWVADHPTNEYAYRLNFVGLYECHGIAVENTSWDSVKNMYR